jgi:hypothetical protein
VNDNAVVRVARKIETAGCSFAIADAAGGRFHGDDVQELRHDSMTRDCIQEFMEMTLKISSLFVRISAVNPLFGMPSSS